MVDLHEWSLAEAILESLKSIAKQENTERLMEVEICYGEMMGLEPEILKFALEELSKGANIGNPRFLLSEEKASFRCNSCGYRWNFEEANKQLSEDLGILEEPTGEKESPLHFIPDLAQALIKCPKCGSRDFEVESGRVVKIARVVFER